MPALPPRPPLWYSILTAEVLACLRFYTRLPLPALDLERAIGSPSFGRTLRWAPLAGLIVGLFGAAALAAAAALQLPDLAGATLALTATILVSGALHEDGLADVADGFGGGATRDRKLEIMRDSRLGTYGAVAIGLSLLLRTSSLAALDHRGGLSVAATALMAAAATSRGWALLPLAWLPPARTGGLGHSAAPAIATAVPVALALAIALGLGLPASSGQGLGPATLAVALAGLAAVGMTRLASRQIGGVTGDVVGAAQQIGEMAFLLGLLAAPALR